MTIALSLKVHDGVVLATDSSSTLPGKTPEGEMSIINVYMNANRIVNLVEGLPLGVMTWGAGAIGPASMTTIFKDLRILLTGGANRLGGASWAIDPTNLTVEDAAARVREYVYEHLYQQQFQGVSPAPELGMVVAGYSSEGAHAEEFQINIDGGGCPAPRAVRPGAECGLTVGGQPEAISRLVMGVDPRMQEVLEVGLGVPATQSAQAVEILIEHLQAPLIADAMPFQDALDLARFLVETTVQIARFMPGPSTVGGPVQVAGITKHEGFKWVSRQHYFDTTMNPREW